MTETEIKKEIMEMLTKSKKGINPSINDLDIIFNNLQNLDHFDCVRVDQIITILYNQKETEYQWASVCMNKKWKTI